jgi:DNA-binding transcriptional LysR family regulator
MLDLNQVRVFVQVVRARSFAEASRRLNVPSNTLSRHIRQLESSLDTRLMQRSTRKLTLTEAGSTFYNRCAAAVDDVLVAGKGVMDGSHVPSGTVRVAAPADFLDLFNLEWLRDFLDRHPKVKLDFVLSDARADLISEGIDVAFRGARSDESAYIFRKLAPQYFKLVASPAYLKQRGVPSALRDLAAHDCLTVGGRAAPSSWTLTGPEGTLDVQVSGHLSANSARVLLNCCLAGLGIALLPNILIAQHVNAGRLIQVLTDYRRGGVDLSVVLPSGEQIPAAVAAFIDFAATQIGSMIAGQEPQKVRTGKR